MRAATPGRKRTSKKLELSATKANVERLQLAVSGPSKLPDSANLTVRFGKKQTLGSFRPDLVEVSRHQVTGQVGQRVRLVLEQLLVPALDAGRG